MQRKIAYVTDIHLDEEFPAQNGIDTRKNWLKVLKDLSSKKIDEIIIGGDIGKTSALDWFFESLNGFKFSISLGNHDKYEEVTKYFNPKTTNPLKLCYSDIKYGYACIFLDSSSDEIDDGQIEWLSKQLLSFDKVLVFIHHPIIEVDLGVDKRYPLRAREKLANKILESKKEVNVFCGHYHCHDEIKERNIYQYITQAVSYQTRKKPKEIEIDNTYFGYIIINIEDAGIKIENIKLTN